MEKDPTTLVKQSLTESIETLKAQKLDLEDRLYQLESELYYNTLIDQGFKPEVVEAYRQEDCLSLDHALSFKTSFNALSSTFFGYPGNLTIDSPLVRRLRHEEAGMFYINNAGDPYEQGNGVMDAKTYERKVLDLFYKKFEMDPTTSWGYISSGGSESNSWGILNGFRKYPQGRLYFCEAAHYSVEKSVLNGKYPLFPYTIIPKHSLRSERIDLEILINTIQRNYRDSDEAAILLLTWGTTKFGSIDDVKAITELLEAHGIPHYVHVDAAFYGGIPNNQIDAPVCPSLQMLGADSISVSFHKFFGVPNINSVVLCKDKASGKEISYLGQHDTTVSGSRTFAIFSAFQRIKEVLERSPQDWYIRNVRYFEDKLKQADIPYFRDGLSNMFVIPIPSQWILDKYQLASFEGLSTIITLAHIIINPFHSHTEMDALFEDIRNDRLSQNSELDI